MIGALIASFIRLPKVVVAAIMAFGSGVLVAALTFSLMAEAFELVQDIWPTIIGFMGGGLSYIAANYALTRKPSGTKHRKRSHGAEAGGGQKTSGRALLVGAVMDNIPENAALGVTLAVGGAVDIVLMLSIFISNLPEGLSSSQGMKAHGRSTKYMCSGW